MDQTSRDQLWNDYVREARRLEDELNCAMVHDDDKASLEKQFRAAVDGLEALKKKFADMKIFLPAYNLRKAQEILNSLRDKIDKKRDACFPRKRFAFKAQPMPMKLVATSQHQSSDKGNTASKKEPTDFILGSFYGFKDIQDASLTIDREESFGKDIQLINLSKCKVLIKGRPCSVSVFKCTDCEINIGPVDSSVFINNSYNCKFQITCHQLRVHRSSKCTFSVHLTSRGIIEDSTNLIFSKYSWDYPGIEEDARLTSLDLNNNNWDKIDDFNWLVKDQPSPNWTRKI